jgi:Uma2 family endonuclease
MQAGGIAMATAPETRATVADLYKAEGKAELIGGRIVEYMATGRKPNRVAFRIVRSLDDHATRLGRGEAYTDNMGFIVAELPSGRESFCPDGSYYEGPFPKNQMQFIDGPPTLGVEFRSENDYGRAAEQEIAEKRADYFAAGTRAVWDVDPKAECVHLYRASAPTTPITFRRGDLAHAEPAVPGWRMAVDEIFG